MNTIMMNNIDLSRNKEAMSLIKNGGKYGCIALGICGLYNLCIKAMEKDYAFNVSFNLEGKIDFNFTPPKVTEK